MGTPLLMGAGNFGVIPPPVLGYSFWFRADGLIINTTNKYGITDVTGNVSQLTDLGGTVITATQATAINQPALIANRIGTSLRKAIRFSGSPQEMAINNASTLTNNVSGATWIAVMKSNAAGTQQIPIIFTTNAAAASRCDLRCTTTNVWRLAGRRLDADGIATVDGTGSSNAAFRILGGAIDYANSDAYIYENGVQTGSNTAFQTNGNTSATNSAAVNIAAVAATNYFAGDIGDILFYPFYLTPAQVLQMHTWLNNFYGLYS